MSARPSYQGGQGKVCIVKYDMHEFLVQCVERYTTLSGGRVNAKLRQAETPFLDEARPDLPPDEFTETNKGVLADVSSNILMKILYAARVARFDLLRPVTALAAKVTKWTKLCDRQLHRLVCYINSTLDVAMYGWMGDALEDLELCLYCDADLARQE